MTGTVINVSPRGFFFIETDGDHLDLYGHQRDVIDGRHLRVDDRVFFEIVQSTRHTGKLEAVNIQYTGHRVAYQRADGSEDGVL